MGWTWDYVEWNVDLPRLRSLQKYWGQNPPVHMLVAAYMQYKPSQGAKSKPSESVTDDQFAALMAAVPKNPRRG